MNLRNGLIVAKAPSPCGEIGVAQYLQALAAGLEPDVRMNPVLVKPEGETRSQVVVNGQVDPALSATPWLRRPEALWPPMRAALHSLLAEFELVVIEGAGSPAEINLRDTDLANMRSAQAAGAPVVLVADIDRGGAFAHLYGTWALLPEEDRELLCGFVLNKFRGDEALLAPGPRMLEDLTQVPTVATIPFVYGHGLPEEDGVFDDDATRAGGAQRTIAVVAYPRISNLDEFEPLKHVDGVCPGVEGGRLGPWLTSRREDESTHYRLWRTHWLRVCARTLPCGLGCRWDRQ